MLTAMYHSGPNSLQTCYCRSFVGLHALRQVVKCAPQLQVLDATDRGRSVPKLAAWYQRCYDHCPAVQKVWGALVWCEAAAVDGGKKPKESKEDRKARKKERDAAKKAELAQSAAAGDTTPATASGPSGARLHAVLPQAASPTLWFLAPHLRGASAQR